MSVTRGALLLADDEERLLKSLGRALREAGHEVTTTASGREARRLLTERDFDVLVVDHRMPGLTGLDLIRDLVERVPAAERPQVIMMTAHASVDNALAAMKLGAFDYLQKPFEVDELLVITQRALEHQRLRRQRRYLITERDEEFDHYGIVGKSRVMQDVIRKIALVATSRSTVLIAGETGTGKELVARAIHAQSSEAEMPLIKVNCGAIPEALLESELFGHVRGAFTGAAANREGKFALADGGTIFLDEVAALPLPLQPKLLRVLQEREVEPLGGTRPRSVDVRVIAATNRNLSAMVADGRFQDDLYYRLNVIPIELPALRSRRDDIPALVEHFLHKHVQRIDRAIERVEPAVLDVLSRYDWPGNVRELENTIERAVVLTTGSVIDVAAVTMPGGVTGATPSLPHTALRENVEWAERESIRRALGQARGVKKDAAQLLGISQRALSYYLGKYKVD